MCIQVKIYVYVFSISACTDEVHLLPLGGFKGISLETYQKNEQWEIVSTGTESGQRMCASNVKFYLRVRRKPLFFLMNIVLPIVILSGMTLNVFWLPSDSGEKVGLAVTIVLSFSVFQLVVSSILPRTSETTPLLCTYAGT